MTDDPLPVAGVMAVALCAILRGWRWYAEWFTLRVKEKRET